MRVNLNKGPFIVTLTQHMDRFVAASYPDAFFRNILPQNNNNIKVSLLFHSMNRSALDSTLPFYWADCYTLNDDHNGLSKVGTPSVGLLIFYISTAFEFLVGVPSNLWLVCHILKKRYTFPCIFGVMQRYNRCNRCLLNDSLSVGVSM